MTTFQRLGQKLGKIFKTNLFSLANMESGQQIYRGDSGDSNDSSVGDIPIELPHLEAQYLYLENKVLASFM